jgi:hypothetical protein
MDLRCRPLQTRDFDGCLCLCRDRLGDPSGVLTRLTTFWNRLLADHAMATTVIEDRDVCSRSPVVAPGTSVFVTDAYMRERGAEPSRISQPGRSSWSSTAATVSPAGGYPQRQLCRRAEPAAVRRGA